jgi:hypothetical protein
VVDLGAAGRRRGERGWDGNVDHSTGEGGACRGDVVWARWDYVLDR